MKLGKRENEGNKEREEISAEVLLTRYSSLNAITHARRYHPTSIIRQKYGNLLQDCISFDLFSAWYKTTLVYRKVVAQFRKVYVEIKPMKYGTIKSLF